MSRMLKRVISVVITAMLMVNLFAVNTSAATSSQRQSAMIQYFQNQGATGISGNITEEDVRLFGIFLSNFYMPFETNLNDPTTYKGLLQDACAFVMGYEDYLSMTSENKAVVDEFYNKMAGSINDVLTGTKYRLYIVPEGSDVDKRNLNSVATLYRWLSTSGNLDMVTEDGTVFFHYSSADTKSNYCNLAMVLSLLSNSADKVQEYLQKDSDTNENSTPQALYITPFGDIVNESGLVIIPGCTNPYTFSSTGNVFPINNSFVMGSYISSNFKVGSGYSNDTAVIPYFDTNGLQARNGFKAPLAVGGLYTKARVDMFDNWGSLTDDQKRTVLKNYIEEAGLPADADEFSFILYYDGDLVTQASETKQSTFWENIFAGLFDLPKLNKFAKSIIISEDDLDSVLQDIYIIPTAKNGYGGFDYTKAEKITLFKSKGETKVAVSENQLISPHMYDYYDPTAADNYKFSAYLTMTQGLSIPECAAIYDDSWTADLGKETLLSNFFAVVGANVKTPKEQMDDVRADIEALLGKEGFEDFRQAVLHQMFQYQYVGASQNIGATLTQAATTAEGSYLPIANQTNFWAEIFYAYMMTGYNVNLPPINLDGLNEALASLLPEVAQTADELAAENQKLANKMLKKGLELVSDTRNTAKADLVLNFADSAILKYHRKMLGINSTDIGSVDNASKMFSGFTSPVTLPTLSELPITATILKHYRSIYIIMLLLALGLTLVLLIMHQRTLRQAIGTMLLLAFCLLLPQTFLDSTVTFTNKITNGMYSDRFNYWAIIQHQQMIQEISVAEESDNENAELLAEALVNVRSYYNKSNGVQLRWMAAKKTQNFTDITSDAVEDASIPGLNTFKWLFSGYLKQESYSTEPMATYVYRTYTSLAQSAADSYEAIEKASGSVKSVNGVEMAPSYSAMANYGTRATSLFYRNVPLSNSTVEQAINNTSVSLTSSAGLDISSADSDDSLSAFLLYSESPFYYFYNTLRATMMPNGTEGEFLHNFLSDDVYKSTMDNQTKGALIDFLDFEGLCSNVIPYMEGANNYVIAWTDKYGTDATGVDGTENVKQTYLNKVWNMYCPWVDSLLSTKITTEDINIFGERYVIENAYNAASYKDYRPMVFSEAQRIDNGITADGLTSVERKLLNVQKATYEDLRYLANYANYDDEVLVTTAAMIATFNFNKEFSETTLGGNGVTLYPQGYELKNFSFDAFLRLILLNSTGISVMSTMDIYEVVLDEEGLFVGILLLCVDALNLYVVPVCMVAFLLVAFVLGVFFTLLMIMQKPSKIIQLTWSTIVKPSLLFMAVTLVYAGGLAVLMGEGLTAYVGAKSAAFVTNSPGVTLIIMLVLVIAMIVLYIRILTGLIKSTSMYVKNVFRTVKDGFGSFKNAVSGAFVGGALGRFATQRSMDAAAAGAGEDMDGGGGEYDNGYEVDYDAELPANAPNDGTVQQQKKAQVVGDEMNTLADDDSMVMGAGETPSDTGANGSVGGTHSSGTAIGSNNGGSSVKQTATNSNGTGSVPIQVTTKVKATNNTSNVRSKQTDSQSADVVNANTAPDNETVDVAESGAVVAETNKSTEKMDKEAENTDKQTPQHWDNAAKEAVSEQNTATEQGTDDTGEDYTFTVE